MEQKIINLLPIILVLIVLSCNKKEENDTGTLVFQGVKTIPVQKSGHVSLDKSSITEPIRHAMYVANLKYNIADIWIAQDLISDLTFNDGIKWYRIGKGNEQKLIEELKFSVDGLPVGTYRSIKINIKTNYTLIAVYQTDISSIVEMPSSFYGECSGDESMISKYFSTNGQYSLAYGNFYCVSSGESIREFKVKPNETTIVYWKQGGMDSKTTDCSFDWIDTNGNSIWDCGIDSVSNVTHTITQPMWTFFVDDGEVDPNI